MICTGGLLVMINFEQYYNEGVISLAKKVAGDAVKGAKKAIGTAFNPAAILRGAGSVLRSAPKVASSVSQFMKQGPSLTGAVANAGGALTAAGNALGQAGQYAKAGWTGQGVINRPQGGEDFDVKTYQNLAASGKIRLDLPAGKTNASQLAAGDIYKVVDKRSGRSTQYKVVGKEGGGIQVVDTSTMQKKA